MNRSRNKWRATEAKELAETLLLGNDVLIDPMKSLCMLSPKFVKNTEATPPKTEPKMPPMSYQIANLFASDSGHKYLLVK